MADPLSGAASAIAVVTLGLAVCKRVYQFYESAKDSREDIRALCDCTHTLRKTLTVLQSVLERAQIPESAVQSVRECIVNCRGALIALSAKLDKIGKSAADPAVLTVSIFLRYAFKEQTIAKLNTRMRQDVLSNLIVAVETLNLEVAVSIKYEVEALAAGAVSVGTLRDDFVSRFERIQIGIDNIADIAAAERLEGQRERLIKWVYESDIVGDFHNGACERREPDTGGWFLDGQLYTSWKTDSKSCLWLYGLPGCGKTILCSSIIEETVLYCSMRPKHHLAYFYFSFTDMRRQRAEDCVRSILRQLLLQRQDVPTDIEDIYRKYRYGTPPLVEWRGALKAMAPSDSSIYIVIDALDECPLKTGERAKILDFLASLLSLNLPNLHILVTSRKEADIERDLQKLVTTPPIGIQGKDVDADIRMHVKAQLENDNTMKEWPAAIRDEVETALTSKANGMFRWIACQLESLRKCLRPSAVRKTLSTLPSTLDETYERILLGISDTYRNEAIAALTWLITSKTELTVEQLAEAVIIDVDSEELFNPSDRLFDPKTILDILSGLVIVTPQRRIFSPDVVRLAHFSVEEYLTSERLSRSEASCFYVPFEKSHITLLNATLSYLQWAKDSGIDLRPPRMEPLLELYSNEAPLLGYACCNWPNHASLAETCLTAKEFRRIEDFLLCPNRMYFATHGVSGPFGELRIDRGCRKMIDRGLRKLGEDRPESLGSPVYYAARLGLLEVVKDLLARGHGTHDLGDELRVACFSREERIVHLLMDAGADVNARGGVYGDAIGACMHAEVPSASIITALLGYGLSAAAGDLNMGWALRWAAMSDNRELVEILIATMHITDAQDYTWTNVFADRRRLTSMGSYMIVERDDVLGSGSYKNRGTAPYEAAVRGHDHVLDRLLRYWSAVDEVDAEGRTALYWASFYGHTNVVRALLAHGARQMGHAQVGEWTPLYWARMRGHDEIRQLLEADEERGGRVDD